MANILMWYQGNASGDYPNCEGGPQFQCPVSKRIAAGYMRDFFTLTNVIAPYFDPDNFGNEGWAKRRLEDVAVGDTMWLLLVPPKHKVVDVAIESHEAKIDLASLASLGGLSVDLVGAKFAEGVDGVCEPTAVATVHASVLFPSDAAAVPQFQVADTAIVTGTTEWYGVGINIKAMPTGTTSLADIKAVIAVIAHAYSYDYQLHM